jgi:glucosamine--fructose-6-phosphate aminotransferase (isomerizing)
VIGRGYNRATALEIALKLKELTHASVGGYSSADFRHGPVATMGEGSAAILVMPEDPTHRDMSDLAEELRARGAKVLGITDGPAAPGGRLPFVAPGAEWLSPVAAIVPGQLLALQLTENKGLSPDGPRGLLKVTRTF